MLWPAENVSMIVKLILAKDRIYCAAALKSVYAFLILWYLVQFLSHAKFLPEEKNNLMEKVWLLKNGKWSYQ